MNGGQTFRIVITLHVHCIIWKFCVGGKIVPTSIYMYKSHSVDFLICCATVNVIAIRG